MISNLEKSVVVFTSNSLKMPVLFDLFVGSKSLKVSVMFDINSESVFTLVW